MRQNPHPTTPEDHGRARRLRRESSPCEHKLWAALRQASASTKLKFRRQQPIHPYVADFACMQARLIVELDGPSHDARQSYDQARDAYLKRQGYTVLRISNDEVEHNLFGVVETIVRYANRLVREAHSQEPPHQENLNARSVRRIAR